MTLRATGLYFATLSRPLLLLLFSLLVGLTLLFNRRPVELPNSFKDVIVPLLTSFSYLAYNLAGLVPAALKQDLLPNSWRVPAAGAALALGIIGYVIAIWSMIYLGRSFSLLISVRRIVSSGPYKYVHHPIYLGYTFLLVGVLLSSCSLFFILVTVTQFLLMVYRARLEERKLSRHSAAYREYIKRTGFLFPKLRRAVDVKRAIV